MAFEGLGDPVHPDTRRALGDAWARVPPSLRTPRQFLGRQYAGCGALIGAMPRCDFACRGCYLSDGANRIPAASLEEIDRQLRSLRSWLGEGGGVQITDGEVALRDRDELLWIVKRARALGLIPMLFTHGDGVLRDPSLLRRLMVAGGLAEVSIHVDTTQRGRRDRRFRYAKRERELHPLRDAFAQLIRSVRAETGLPLDVAMTVTVTPESVDDVGEVVGWVLRNADAFKMVSFQPIAQVGRTEDGLGGGVSSERVWKRIGAVLEAHGSAERAEDLVSWLGHPDCSRFVQGAVRLGRGAPRFTSLYRPNDDDDARVVSRVMQALGGFTLRVGSSRSRWRRIVAAGVRAPGVLFGTFVPQLWRVAGRLAPEGRLRWLAGLASGRERVAYLNIVSHHFMSADELATERGQERLALCAFKVSVDGRLVSMCEANALGVRERFYGELANGTRV